MVGLLVWSVGWLIRRWSATISFKRAGSYTSKLLSKHLFPCTSVSRRNKQEVYQQQPLPTRNSSFYSNLFTRRRFGGCLWQIIIGIGQSRQTLGVATCRGGWRGTARTFKYYFTLTQPLFSAVLPNCPHRIRISTKKVLR